MIPKTTAFFSIITALLTVLHQNAHATFTAGIQAGYGHGHAHTVSNYNNLTISPIPQESNFGFHGALGGLFLGYDLTMGQNFILGLETNAALSGIKGTETRTTATVAPQQTDTIRQKLNSSFDVLLRTGYQSNSLMGYCKLGVAFGLWEFKSSINTLPIDFQKKRTLPGLKLAVGFEGNIVKNLAWGIEYNYTFFKSHTIHRPDEDNEDLPHRVKPNYGAVLVRIMYKFK